MDTTLTTHLGLSGPIHYEIGRMEGRHWQYFGRCRAGEGAIRVLTQNPLLGLYFLERLMEHERTAEAGDVNVLDLLDRPLDKICLGLDEPDALLDDGRLEKKLIAGLLPFGSVSTLSVAFLVHSLLKVTKQAAHTIAIYLLRIHKDRHR